MRLLILSVLVIGLVVWSFAIYGGCHAATCKHNSTASAGPTIGRATVNAVWLTGRLMQCFGGCESGQCDYQCRPVGISQTEHPEIIVKPVVACWASLFPDGWKGECKVVSK